MNFQEIIAKARQLGMDKSDIAYGEFDDDVFGEVREVYSKGGEGKGEDWERVYHFVDHNVYLSMQGFYSSYGGTDFDNYEPKEVFPKQKTVTVFE